MRAHRAAPLYSPCPRGAVTARKKLKFYDLKARQSFETDEYEVVERQTARGPMLFAVAESPLTGMKVWRLLGRAGK